jgi:hypothetical protein
MVDASFGLVFLTYDVIVSMCLYGLWFVPFLGFITFAYIYKKRYKNMDFS